MYKFTIITSYVIMLRALSFYLKKKLIMKIPYWMEYKIVFGMNHNIM